MDSIERSHYIPWQQSTHSGSQIASLGDIDRRILQLVTAPQSVTPFLQPAPTSSKLVRSYRIADEETPLDPAQSIKASQSYQIADEETPLDPAQSIKASQSYRIADEEAPFIQPPNLARTQPTPAISSMTAGPKKERLTAQSVLLATSRKNKLTSRKVQSSRHRDTEVGKDKDPELVPFRPFMALELRYDHLFQRNIITYTREQFPRVLDVGMDKFKVFIPKKGSLGLKTVTLGTSHAATCIAIAMRGKTANGALVLGMTHASGLMDGRNYLKRLWREMRVFGATEKSICTFLIGGQLVDPQDPDDSHTLDNEKRLLSLEKAYRIQEVRLHINHNKDSSVFVVMTRSGIFYSRQPIFTPNPDGIGNDILE